MRVHPKVPLTILRALLSIYQRTYLVVIYNVLVLRAVLSEHRLHALSALILISVVADYKLPIHHLESRLALDFSHFSYRADPLPPEAPFQ